jgi:hypothetical protein
VDEEKKPAAPSIGPDEGPSIGPADAPAAPLVFCLGGSIGCETLDFLRAKGGKFLLVSAPERMEAIDIERRILLKARAAQEPANTLIDPDAGFRWRQGIAFEAQFRVDKILAKDVGK